MLEDEQQPKNPKPKLMALEDEQQPKTIKASDSSSSQSHPTEIMFEILSRLPVESLLRCKSVCKSWHSLISDPYFIKYHLTLSTTNHHNTHHRLLVCNMKPVTTLKTCPLYDVLNDNNTINPLELDYPMKHSSKMVSIVGSCNGLICITIEPHNVFIWNPSTRKSIQLPDSPRSAAVFVVHGFGYHESSHDYKVVEITCSSDEGRDDNVVMIYSSKNGNWKEIGSFPQFLWSNIDYGVFLKGALHWIAAKDRRRLITVSLDLAKETYNEVLLPVDNDEPDIDYVLGIVGNSLSVLHVHSRNDVYFADVWVMKVYGVKDSWFKLVYIPSNRGCYFSAPLCVSNDGKVLMQLDSKLIVFDTKNDQALQIEKFNQCTEACTFVESLVSPSGHENLI